jgi:N-acetylglutamate synthase-like GNAT family acetyltransferase
MTELTVREATNADAAAVMRIVSTVLEEYGLKADPATTDRDILDIEASYQANGGTFRVVEAADLGVVGCGGLYRVGADEVELRKMYLLPVARGQGVGKRMLRDFIAAARQMGAARMSLETASVLKEAIGLYKGHGFIRVSRTDLTARCDQAWELRLS